MSIREQMVDDLTFNEVVIMYAVVACLVMHCLKNRFCPNAWSTDLTVKISKGDQEDEDLTIFASEEENKGNAKDE